MAVKVTKIDKTAKAELSRRASLFINFKITIAINVVTPIDGK